MLLDYWMLWKLLFPIMCILLGRETFRLFYGWYCSAPNCGVNKLRKNKWCEVDLTKKNNGLEGKISFVMFIISQSHISLSVITNWLVNRMQTGSVFLIYLSGTERGERSHLYVLQTPIFLSSKYLLHSKQISLLIIDPMLSASPKHCFITKGWVRTKGTCFSPQQHSITNPLQIVIAVQLKITVKWGVFLNSVHFWSKLKPSSSEYSQTIFSQILKAIKWIPQFQNE